LYERSEGNAFLVEEILGALQDGAGASEHPVILGIGVLTYGALMIERPRSRRVYSPRAGTAVIDAY
jgi:hypothetical protein